MPNHYLFHIVDPVPPLWPHVELEGQFDDDLLPGDVGPLMFLGNPAEKWREPDGHTTPEHPRRHLTWHDLFSPGHEPLRHVLVETQFGPQRLELGPPVALLSPAAKRDGPVTPEPLPVPDGNHYKVYAVLYSEPNPVPLWLRDQFYPDRYPVSLGPARFFGVPVRKRHGNADWPIHDDSTHLVLYDIAGPPAQQERMVYDQFHPEGVMLHAHHPMLFAAPATKVEIPHDVFSTDDDACDFIRLEHWAEYDHHKLTAYNDHRTKRIRATVAWTWTPDSGDPEPKERTITVSPMGQTNLAFEYGKGAITSYELVACEYVEA